MASIVPDMDWSSLATLGQTYQKAKQQAQRDQVLGSIPADATPESLGQIGVQLAKIGDPAGMPLIHLAQSATRDTRDFGFRQQESNRAQTNADRAFDFQKQQAEEAARGFETREVDDPATGGKRFIRVEKATGKAAEVPIESAPGSQTTPNNPFAYGKQNEGQSKDSGFANRMFRAEGVLRDPKVEAAALSMKNAFIGGIAAKEGIAGMIANGQLGPDYQRFDQAQRDFINATLRRESGAAIAESEFANARKQYFPQPNDTPERLAEKKKNRQDAIAGVAGGGGQTYKPPFTFGPGGELVPTNNPVQGATPAPKPPGDQNLDRQAIQAARANPQAALADAKAAIAGGASPEALVRLLKMAGINPALLTGETTTGFASPGQRQ